MSPHQLSVPIVILKIVKLLPVTSGDRKKSLLWKGKLGAIPLLVLLASDCI